MPIGNNMTAGAASFEEEQARIRAFQAAMANGGVADPSMYEPSQLNSRGQVPYAVGGGSLTSAQPQSGPWGDAKYSPAGMRAPMNVAKLPSPGAVELQAPTGPVPATPPMERPVANSAPLEPAPDGASTASPPPMERPSAEDEGTKGRSLATQTNRNANTAFRMYMENFARQGR